MTLLWFQGEVDLESALNCQRHWQLVTEQNVGTIVILQLIQDIFGSGP